MSNATTVRYTVIFRYLINSWKAKNGETLAFDVSDEAFSIFEGKLSPSMRVMTTKGPSTGKENSNISKFCKWLVFTMGHCGFMLTGIQVYLLSLITC
jgi:hypothetical protein